MGESEVLTETTSQIYSTALLEIMNNVLMGHERCRQSYNFRLISQSALCMASFFTSSL